MTSLDSVAASVSAEAYRSPANRAEQLVGDWKIDRNVSSEDVAVYVNDTKQQVLVGFRGTTLSAADLQLVGTLILGVGQTQPFVNKGMEAVRSVRSVHASKAITLTGHSKGAWLASKVARSGDKVIGFAPATSLADIVQSYKPRPMRAPEIVYHSVAGDVLSIPSYFLRGVKHTIQSKTLLSVLAANVGGTVRAHQISNFL